MKTLIAIPCGDFVHTEFTRAILGMKMIDKCQVSFAQGSLIYDARNQLAQIALSGGYDRVLWLDSDMGFPTDLMERLFADLDEGREMVTGLYFTRKAPIKPTCYKELYLTQDGMYAMPHCDEITEWGDEVFEVAGCGFGAVAMTTELLKKVVDKFVLPFTPVSGFGEDLSFCLRAADVGAKIWCDPRPKLTHVGLGYFTEDTFRKVQNVK